MKVVSRDSGVLEQVLKNKFKLLLEMIKKDLLVVLVVGCFFAINSCAPRVSYSPKPAMPNSSYNYQNNYQRSYQPQYQPNSRSYSNPYNYPSRNYYQYYDFDQYYVPPTQYKSIEKQTFEEPFHP